jgi:ABC-type methionine transport system permease subunit
MAEEALSDTEKEQIKLRATFLNNIGIGAILVGTLTPITRLIYGESNGGLASAVALGTPVACFVIGVTLHLTAMKVLERLDR